MNDLPFLSATETASMVRRKKISARELTELMLARIAAFNPALNAVVDAQPDVALQAATAADHAIASGRNGPLLGVPMTIKDAFDVAGLHTTWGNPAFRDYVARHDAVVVQRLREAGAIIVGKTNVPFMLGDFGQTRNDLYGVTSNPWDTSRTPGGSSGGCAAALAAGLSWLEYGSDLVGSIRIPAAFCGVYGLKPSVGIVPLDGFQPPGAPPAPADFTYMSAIGPLARSAADVRLALTVSAGPSRPAAHAYTWTLAPPRHTRLFDFRVGVALDHSLAPPTSEVSALLSTTVAALERAGARVVEGWPEGIDPARSYASFGFHVQLFFAYQQPDQPFERQSELIDQQLQRMSARAAWSRYFQDVDVFLCPTNVTPAFPHDSRPFEERIITTPEGDRPYDSQAFWVSHASLAGLPAVTAPIGRTSAGLPVGAQIIGPLYEDDSVLTFAELLGQVVGGFESPAMAIGVG
jgi:amidase